MAHVLSPSTVQSLISGGRVGFSDRPRRKLIIQPAGKKTPARREEEEEEVEEEEEDSACMTDRSLTPNVVSSIHLMFAEKHQDIHCLMDYCCACLCILLFLKTNKHFQDMIIN